MIVRRRRKQEENAAQGKKGHFWMETRLVPGLIYQYKGDSRLAPPDCE